MKFTWDYNNQPIKFLKQQDKHIVDRILNKIEATLSENPVPQNALGIEVGAIQVDSVYRIVREKRKTRENSGGFTWTFTFTYKFSPIPRYVQPRNICL